ncbi:MAG: hypothetical protein ACR2PZ_01575 [Pseudomonadales bacterium]
MSGAVNGRRQRVHIIGCYRSGTTLLMELLWHCFEFGDRTRHETSLFDPVPEGAGLYLTKKPPDTIWIEKVFREDEDLFLIAMRRDPRAVITSIHRNQPDKYFRSFHVWEDYNRAITAMEGHPRFLVLNFEDLLRDPGATQDRIQQAFPFLQRTGAFGDYPQGFEIDGGANESLNGARPFDTTRIESWRQHLPRVKAQIEQYPQLREAVTGLGYEPDDAWLQMLDGVLPDDQQYKVKRPSWLRRLDTQRRYRRKIQRYRETRGLA